MCSTAMVLLWRYRTRLTHDFRSNDHQSGFYLCNFIILIGPDDRPTATSLSDFLLPNIYFDLVIEHEKALLEKKND